MGEIRSIPPLLQNDVLSFLLMRCKSPKIRNGEHEKFDSCMNYLSPITRSNIVTGLAHGGGYYNDGMEDTYQR